MDSGQGTNASKKVILAIIAACVVVGAVFGSYFISLTPPVLYKVSSASNSLASTTSGASATSTQSTTSPTILSSSSSSTSTVATGNVTITSIYDDVTLSNPQQLQSMLLYNASTIGGKPSSVVVAGQTFSVQAEIDFQACPCVHYVISVQSMTPGFVVVNTTPLLPLQFSGIGGDTYTAGFSVELVAPSAPYSGNLTLVARCG